MSNDKDWINELKKGDKVIVIKRHYDLIETVERSTKTQIILTTGSKYRKSDCNLVGASKWDIDYIIEATDEELNRIEDTAKRTKLIDSIKSSDLTKLTTAQLEQIQLIIG